MAKKNRPLLEVKTEAQLQEEEGQARQNDLRVPDTDLLAMYVRQAYMQARNARDTSTSTKQSVSTRIIESQRQVNCVYDASILQEIAKTGGTTEYDPVTIQKCLTTEAWLRDILAPTDDRPFYIEPSPIPDLPEDAMAKVAEKAASFFEEMPQAVQEGEGAANEKYIAEKTANKVDEIADAELMATQEEARKRAKRMETRIYDQLADGDFQDAFSDFVEYTCRSLIGAIKGPVYRRERRLAYSKPEGTEGNWTVEAKDEERMTFNVVDPANLFFSPTCRHQDTGNIFEIMPLQASSVQKMMGVDGYKDEAIINALRDYSAGGLREWTTHSWEADSIADRPRTEEGGYNGQIDVIDAWMKCPGKKLKSWGVKDFSGDDEIYYDIHAMLIGRHVVLCELNTDILGRRPYHITSFEKQAGSMYGRGIPEKIRPAQRAANVCRRALINNIAIASGPQTVVDPTQLADGEVITSMQPWKVWQAKHIAGATSKPVDFFQPDSNARELVELLEKFYSDADRDTGIPRYVQGDQQGAMRGAAGTASGLSMLMGAASKSMKQVIHNMDVDVIQRVVEMLYDRNMADPEVPEDEKGDFNIRTKGALALAQKEQLQQARMEFMDKVLANEVLYDIVGKDGVVVLLREMIKGLEMPMYSIVPSDYQLEKDETSQYEQMFGEVVQAALDNEIIDEQAAQLLLNPEAVLQEQQAAPAQ